jgi:hypothetical protein
MEDGMASFPWESFLMYLKNVTVITVLHFSLLIGVGLVLGIFITLLSRTIWKHGVSIFSSRLYAYLLFPGVVLHELTHWLFLVFFGYQIEKVRLFQYKRDDPRLGYVAYRTSGSYFQRVGGFFSSVGPITVGSVIIYILSVRLLGTGWFEGVSFTVTTGNSANLLNTLGQLVESILLNFEQIFTRLFAVRDVPGWQIALFFYLAFAILNAMDLSSADIKSARPGFILLIVGLFMVNLLTLWAGGDLIGAFFTLLSRPLCSFYAVMLFVLCFNACLAFIVVPLGMIFGGGRRW